MQNVGKFRTAHCNTQESQNRHCEKLAPKI